ncbi:LpqB family beta-propeller domain-containing protein [Kineococcus sp. SYSU DK006]|uniref:LpqB family beta-propeller domain-containing protein n=1 Tax=Kineococcus sp. SYSU DK006 TaxID=3383127 RepID=UPI003D7ECE19
MRPARAPGRAPGRAGAALLVCALLAGCGGIPRSSEVVGGARPADDPRTGLLQVIPERPARGASAVEVVRGFLLAGASSDDDHAVAREFLSAPVAQTWRPDTATTLVETTPELSLLAQDATGATVEVSARVTAVVDEAGHYAAQAPGTPLRRQLHLVREGGQWRLTDPGDGVVLTGLDASRTLRPFPVWFATPASPQAAQVPALLVPDVRWFGYDSSTATRIVRALLEGPAPWLAPGVRTGAPAGTRLRVGTVPVAAGTATVELTGAALDAGPDARGLLLAQLRASLTGLPEVDEVRVTVGGADLTRTSEQDPGPPVLPRAATAADARLVLLGERGLERWDRTGAREVTGTGPGLSPAAAAHPAAALDGSAYAVLTDAGRVLRVQQPGGPLQAAVTGQGPLAPPSVDRFGWAWTAPAAPAAAPAAAAAPLAVPVARPDAPAVRVQPPADGLAGTVLRLRVSRDGTRVLVVSQDAAGATSVHVHAVVRDGAGAPLRLSGPGGDLVPGAGTVLDAAWLPDDEFVVLARPAGQADPVPLLARVSGPVAALPAVPGAVSVAAGWSERDVVVGTADGRLLARSGAGWVPVAEGRDPAYPG